MLRPSWNTYSNRILNFSKELCSLSLRQILWKCLCLGKHVMHCHVRILKEELRRLFPTDRSTKSCLNFCVWLMGFLLVWQILTTENYISNQIWLYEWINGATLNFQSIHVHRQSQQWWTKSTTVLLYNYFLVMDRLNNLNIWK